ncbi:hypothetical protein STEG23_020180, partial [Scotinomys teguina]
GAPGLQICTDTSGFMERWRKLQTSSPNHASGSLPHPRELETLLTPFLLRDHATRSQDNQSMESACSPKCQAGILRRKT